MQYLLNYFQNKLTKVTMIRESTQMLPSLSSWAYRPRGISEPEFVTVSSVPVAVNGHIDSDFIHTSPVLPYPPSYTSSFHGVQYVNKEQSYHTEPIEVVEDGELVYITEEPIPGIAYTVLQYSSR